MTECKNLDPKAIGERIRIQREKLKLSREEFAEILELSTYYIGQIERGNRNMSINTLYKISESLNISIDYIIKGEVKYMEDILILESLKDIYEETPNDEIKEIINLLSGASKVHIKLIKDIIKLTIPHMK